MAALAQFGLEIDGASHPFRRFAHNSQADAGAIVLTRRVDSLEHAKYSVPVFGSDANAIVLNVNADQFSDALGPDGDTGRHAWRNE